VTGRWKKRYKEELHDVYSSLSIRMMKSRRMRWAEHVDKWGRRGMVIGCW
jgi:hypothetical protein